MRSRTRSYVPKRMDDGGAVVASSSSSFAVTGVTYGYGAAAAAGYAQKRAGLTLSYLLLALVLLPVGSATHGGGTCKRICGRKP